MMVSDVLPCSAPRTKDKRHPSIPIRSSSISRAKSTDPLDRSKSTIRHSLFRGSDCQLDHLNHDSTPESTTTASSFPPRRAHSQPRMHRTSTNCSMPSKNSAELANVQRWAGLTRSVCNWDGLRKDPELWIQNGDCLIHLYGLGASKRGPSFCVPLRALRQKSCGAMLDICYAQTTTEIATVSQESRRLRSFDNLHRGSALVELYIPAPESASREESFDWHITTRNFFAYVLGQPLVGRHMGQTFVDLLERMKLFRSQNVDNHHDFLEYAENQGYRDLVECTDYTLASLYYAERYKLREVWIDAFAHCVGMSDSIALSPEYASISRLTKALITRAYLEVDLHLDRVARALRTFLQEDFSPAYLGLTHGARNHLNRFQQFVHNFYVEKFGYWPPPKNASTFPKALYQSMFYDFKNLYELLVDTQSGNDISSQKPASGGICVLQIVDHFDKRHKFTAQPHTLPLLPQEPPRLTRSLSSASHYRKTCDDQSNSAALAAATNVLDAQVTKSGIIQAYMQFEKTCVAKSSQREDKISAVDARKIRWLLIYGTLQYLTSALRAPTGVRDTESPEYPLCCFVAGQSSWNSTTPISTPSLSTPTSVPRVVNDYFEEAQCGSLSIQPDCHRDDYLTSTTAARRHTAEMSSLYKAQLPVRQSSTRSFGPLSLSIRSSRRNSLTLKPTPHCPIIVHGYGDGLNQATTQVLSQSMVGCEEIESSPSSKPTSPQDTNIETSWLNPQDPPIISNKSTSQIEVRSQIRSHTRNRTPLLHTFQLDQVAQVAQPADTDDSNESMSRSDSTSSTGSSVWTDGGSAASSKSSADGERQHFYKASTAEHSGLLGGLVSVDGTRVSLDTPDRRSPTTLSPERDIHPLLRKPSVQQDGFCFDFDTQNGGQANSADAESLIGVAISAPPSPPILNLASPITPLSRTMSLTSEKKKFNVLETNTIDSTSTPDAYIRKKSRSSDIFAGLISSSTDLRDRYSNAMKRTDNSETSPLQFGHLCSGTKSETHPPTVTKTSHATRTPSLRNRIFHDNVKDLKKEKRVSLIWRR